MTKPFDHHHDVFAPLDRCYLDEDSMDSFNQETPLLCRKMMPVAFVQEVTVCVLT